MAQISYGTITITDTTDIERIYPVYCKGNETNTPSLQPLTNWSENVSQAGGTGDYIWQRIVTKKQGIAVTANDYSDAVRLTGDDGTSLTITNIQYAQTQHENDTPSYGSSMPSSINEGWWLWVKTTYSDGSFVETKVKQGQTGVSVTATRELYWLKTNSTNPSQITWNSSTSQPSQTIYSVDRQNSWTSVIPTYIANGTYYTCIETTLSNSTKTWSIPAINNGLTNANEKALNAYDTSVARDTEINALQAQAKYFWWDSEGAHVAAGDSSGNITHERPATYNFNALTAPGALKLRYKDVNLAQLATNSLTFYQPPTISGDTITQGNKTMELDGTSLKFYGTNQTNPLMSLSGQALNFYQYGTNTAAATLASDGLQITNGSIVLGTTSGTDAGNVTLSNKDFTRAINGTSHNDLRFAIGSKFGVASDGTLYSSGLDSVVSRVDIAETSLGNKVDTSTFNTLSQTVDGNSASITELSTITTNNGLTKTTNITNTVNTVSQTATGNSSKISSLTNTLGTNADGTTKAGDIVHRTSAVEQDLSGFKTTVSKTYHKTSDFNTYKAANDTAVAAAKKAGDDAQADLDEYKGTVSETYATKSSLTQTAEGIRTDVSSTYETKTDASAKLTEAKGDATTKANKALTDAKADTTNKLKSYYTKTETDSAITQKAGEISLSVAQTEISKIEVGGRNLAVNTSGEDWYSVAITDGTNKIIRLFGLVNQYAIDIPSIAGVKAGDLIQVSFDIKFSSDWKATGTGTKRSYVQGSCNQPTSWVSASYNNGGGNQEDNLEAIMASSSKEGHIHTWFVVTSDMLNGTYTGLTISDIRFDYYSGTASVRRVMVEKATKPSSWTPAPEDLEAYTDTQVSAAKAEIKVTTDGISTEVAKKTDKSTIISTIRQSAESVKIKASQVEIDGTATFNAIKSSTDAAYDAKGAAQSAVDGIEVGGRNLLIGTPESTELTTAANQSWFSPQPYKLSAYANTAIADTDNTNISISFDYSITGVDTAFNMVASLKSTSSSWNAAVKVAEIPVGSSSGHAFGSRDITDGVRQYAPNNGILISGSGNGNANAKLTISNVKVEFGNKATDWTPAPEDVQGEIDTKKSVHTLMTGNSSGNTYANILGFVAEGHSQQWTVNTATTPLTNVKIGDTCRIAYKVSDMNGAYVYPTGVVTNIGTNTVTMTMHGLDTTIIDGGNILTNSITANQIATNAITADELAANAVTANKIATNAVTTDKIAAGAITVGKIDPIVYKYSNVGQGTGYAKLCTISVTEKYRNKPIQFTLHSRNKNATAVSWRFLNSNSPSTCTVSSATYDGDTPLYYVGTGGTYTIYFALGESYDEVRIYDLIIPYDTGLTVAWAGEYYGTSLPSGAVAFTKLAGTRTSAELDNAAKTATTYITHIDNNGIRVHPSSTENNSVVINASGMEVFKGGTTSAYSVAKYGDTARIGKESGSHLTLAPDSMSMSTGTKDVFNLLQKTMYIYWTRNYKGRQFANSTDRHVDSWETNTTISTWDSIAVNYKLNNTSRTKKITSISNGVLANDEIYVHFNYSGTKITLTYGRGSSAASSDIIKLESAVVYYVTDEKLSQLHTGTYPNTTVSGALRIGNGTSDSNRINLMLVDWSGTGKFKGDILAFCGADSSGGMSLTKAEENIDAFKYEDANGHVYIDAYRVGRIVSLLCTLSKTASIAPGADLYRLDLTNAHLPKPLGTNTSGTGISRGNVIIGNIYYNKTVTPNRYEFVCRNGGSTAVSTGGVGFTITYICQMDEVSGEIKYMDD